MDLSKHNLPCPGGDKQSQGGGFTVLIAAAGSGSRMKNSIPKQFLPLAGKPLLMHTIQLFHDFDPNMPILVAIPASFFQLWNALCKEYNFTVETILIEGGETRFETVGKGLDCVEVSEFIAIHDGARPFTSHELLRRCFKGCREKGSTIPVIGSKDSVRQIKEGGNASIPRDDIVMVQTPQCFNTAVLKAAYKSTGKSISYTDEAGLADAHGIGMHLVDGEDTNIKITSPLDFALAETLLAKDDAS